MDADTNTWYDGNAASYSKLTNSFSSFPGLKGDLEAFLKLLPKHALIADLGSGSGRDAKFFSEAGHRVITLDTSREMLRFCLHTVLADHRVYPVVGDIEQLPFANQSIDGIWACGSLLHVSNASIPDIVGTCYQLIKPGGAIGISMKDGAGSKRRIGGRLETYVSKRDLILWLHEMGFVDIQVTGPSRGIWLLALAQKHP